MSNETFLDNFENDREILKNHIEKCSNDRQVIEVKKATLKLCKVIEIINKTNKG